MAITGRARVGEATADSGIYIVHSGNAIKIGTSRNVPNRLTNLRIANPNSIELVFFGRFGVCATEIERKVHANLKPWRIHGEWFAASPFLAGLAIEAVRDNCSRRLAFIELYAQIYAARLQPEREILLDQKAECEFPDLYARLRTPAAPTTSGLGGRIIQLPRTKFTRLIVEGYPEVTWGMPAMPPKMAAAWKIKAEVEERQRKRALRRGL